MQGCLYSIKHFGGVQISYPEVLYFSSPQCETIVIFNSKQEVVLCIVGCRNRKSVHSFLQHTIEAFPRRVWLHVIRTDYWSKEFHLRGEANDHINEVALLSMNLTSSPCQLASQLTCLIYTYWFNKLKQLTKLYLKKLASEPQTRWSCSY